MARDSQWLGKHRKEVHGHGINCAKCCQVYGDKTKLSKHMAKHHKKEWSFACEVCKTTFKTLSEAREHALKPCGGIKSKPVVIDIEEVDNKHRCNACSISFSNNDALEKHMEEEHQIDCTTCQATFKKKDDVYSHANICSKVIAPLMCDECNIELISRARLKRHMEKCKKSRSSKEAPSEACTNGPDCRFLKENRCLYGHDEPNNQPWQKVQQRRQGRRQQSRQQQQPRRQQQPQQQQQPRQQLQARQQLPRRQAPRQQLQECKNGPGCIYWKHDRCNFSHSGSKQQIRKGVDSRQHRQGSAFQTTSPGSGFETTSPGPGFKAATGPGLETETSWSGLEESSG